MIKIEKLCEIVFEKFLKEWKGRRFFRHGEA